MSILTSVLMTALAFPLHVHAQTEVNPNQPSVLHLALVQSYREHVNFELAQARLRDANPDRRIITMVRERAYASDGAQIQDRAIDALNVDLRTKLTEVPQPIDMVYVQINDFTWMSEAWSFLEGTGPAEAVTRNPILALRGRLTPEARLVFVGHSVLGNEADKAEARTRNLLDYLGAPQGSLIAQVTPTLLSYRDSDIFTHTGIRAGAALMAGNVVAYPQLGAGAFGLGDAALFAAVAGGITFRFKDQALRQTGPDAELKPDLVRNFLNIDDLFFRAGLGVGTAASLHMIIHQGFSSLFADHFMYVSSAVGVVYFIASLAPKLVHNAYVTVVNRTRDRNRARVYHATRGAVQEVRADDARAFSCSGAFVEPPGSSAVL